MGIGSDFLKLRELEQAIMEVSDTLGAVRYGLTQMEGKAIRADLERSRIDLVAKIKAGIDKVDPENGKDFDLLPAPFDEKRAQNPTGYISPIGDKDVERILHPIACLNDDIDDYQISAIRSFGIKAGGMVLSFAVWSKDESSDDGMFYTYGDAAVLKQLFGSRYKYAGS